MWSWPSPVQRSVTTEAFTLLSSEENDNQLECLYGRVYGGTVNSVPNTH